MPTFSPSGRRERCGQIRNGGIRVRENGTGVYFMPVLPNFYVSQHPQNIGWRYFPGSNTKKPCACEYCLKGTFKGKKTRTRLNPG